MLISRRRLLLGAGLYLLFLLLLFPAAYPVSWFAKALRPVQLVEVDGSLWRGHVEQLRTNKTLINDVSWKFHLLPLLLGRLEMGLTIGDKRLPLSLDAGYNLFGKLSLNNINGRIKLAEAQAMTPYRFPRLNGWLRLDDVDLQLKERLPSDADGQIHIEQLSVQLGEEIALGDYRVQLEGLESGISIIIINTNKRFDGQISAILAQDKKLSLEVDLKPLRKNDPIAKQLELFAKPNAQGRYQFKRQISLPL